MTEQPNVGEAARPLNPRRLVLALLGELYRDHCAGPFRAVDLVCVLQAAGVSAPAARAALDRFVLRGLLLRDKSTRGVSYELTEAGEQLLAAGSARVHAVAPFEPQGAGWTIVTFSVPEGHRGLRHKLRAALTWAGFALLRDGVWIAAGERDIEVALDALSGEAEAAGIIAFRAHDLDAFPMAGRVHGTWDLQALRAAHEEFLERWGHPESAIPAASALAATTLLVADWLTLLRKDPRLPLEYLGDDWPAQRSHAAYLACRERFAEQAYTEGCALVPAS